MRIHVYKCFKKINRHPGPLTTRPRARLHGIPLLAPALLEPRSGYGRRTCCMRFLLPSENAECCCKGTPSHVATQQRVSGAAYFLRSASVVTGAFSQFLLSNNMKKTSACFVEECSELKLPELRPPSSNAATETAVPVRMSKDRAATIIRSFDASPRSTFMKVNLPRWCRFSIFDAKFGNIYYHPQTLFITTSFCTFFFFFCKFIRSKTKPIWTQSRPLTTHFHRKIRPFPLLPFSYFQ